MTQRALASDCGLGRSAARCHFPDFDAFQDGLADFVLQNNCSILQNVMPPADDTTITVRLPAHLKGAVDALCGSRGMTLTGLVRRSLEEFVVPSPRVFELPGFTKAFDEFLTSKDLQDRRGRALLLVVDDGGHRAMYPGYIDFNLISGGIVGINLVRQGGQRIDPPLIIMRKNIAGWYSAAHDFFNGALVETLHRMGWAPFQYGPR